jgi:hypothetical protein
VTVAGNKEIKMDKLINRLNTNSKYHFWEAVSASIVRRIPKEADDLDQPVLIHVCNPDNPIESGYVTGSKCERCGFVYSN